MTTNEITKQSSTFGKVTIKLWQGKRAYINCSEMRKGVGYINLVTGELVGECGNSHIPYNLLASIGMTTEEVIAAFK